MKIVICVATLLTASSLQVATSQNILNNVINAGKNVVSSTTNGNKGAGLSNDEIIKGLKEALSIGTNNSTASASKTDGFLKNAAIKIPFPKEAQDMEKRLRAIGMGKQCDEFITTLNRAAEKAAVDAAPIFLNAIKGMTLTDGLSILKGSDNAATSYLKNSTSADLKAKFLPVVKNALQQVQITKYWNPLFTRYNKIPMVQKVNPDLDAYVTSKAMEGLFKLVEGEELKIRKDPGARVTDLLKKVFG